MTERWSEANSADFVELGALATPWRGELTRAFLALLPAARDEPFQAVDLGAGSGWLAEALLSAFSRASVLVADGSETMLAQARARLAPFEARTQLRRVELEDETWLPRLAVMPRAVLSCLAIHHLDADGKRRLYRQAHERLEPGGVLLVADVVAHRSDWARRYWARLWEDDVRRAGEPALAERFVKDGWNFYDHPVDPIDKPSGLPEQLAWLEAIGYEGVDVFWAKAGHALFGGYKTTEKSRE